MLTDVTLRANPDAVTIVQLSPDTIQALAVSDIAAAGRMSGLDLPDYLVSACCVGTWRFRAAQVDVDPEVAGWVTGVIWDAELGTAVGQAGFHGPPDGEGMVEVGYSVDPRYRRRGYARAALGRLVERATREPDASRIRASVSPDNVASRDLVLSFGLVQVGEQWDEEDGLEIVYERPVR